MTSGHLLYVRRGTLYAVPFDPGRLQVAGPSIAVADDVGADPATGGAQLSVSEAGSLIYLQGHGFSPGAPAVWMDRGGNTMPLRTKRSEWGNPRFSPDGKQLAFDVSDGKQVDVWVQDLATEQLRRLTFDQADEIKPVWSPDGRWIAFASNREGPLNLYRIRSDGVGSPERLTQSRQRTESRLVASQRTIPGVRGESSGQWARCDDAGHAACRCRARDARRAVCVRRQPLGGCGADLLARRAVAGVPVE